MENQRLINSAFIGGLASAVLFSVPFLNIINCFCCAGIMIGGAIALIYYDQTYPEKKYISVATTFNVGLMSGIAGAFISIFLDWIIFTLFGNWELKLVNILGENLSNIPEMDELLYELEIEASKGYYFGRVILEFLRNIILIPLFSVSGALIVRIFVNKNRT